MENFRKSNQKPINLKTSSNIPLKEAPKQIILFAPAPDKDGSFNGSVVVPVENQSSSFYKFTLIDKNRAEFEFINNDRAVRDALSSYEMILKPVCTFNNALNQNAKRIITNKKGIVVQNNNKWTLNTKSEITYE